MRDILVSLACLCAVLSVSAAEIGSGPEKRLIEIGWDCPTPAFIHKHIDQMQERPFDGVVFRLQGKDRLLGPKETHLPALHTAKGPIDLQAGSRVLLPTAFEESDFAEEYRLLSEIDWGRFTCFVSSGIQRQD